MRRALDRGTAALRMTEGVFAEFPASTPEAIASGAVQACTGAIMRMHEAMTQRGHAPETILLSGGAANELAPHLAAEHAIHANLVLDGLALIARAG
jgi:type III pantothenate kinase